MPYRIFIFFAYRTPTPSPDFQRHSALKAIALKLNVLTVRAMSPVTAVLCGHGARTNREIPAIIIAIFKFTVK